MNELIEYINQIFYNSFIYENRYLFLLDGLWMTLLLTVTSFLLGTVVAVLLCAGRLSGARWLDRALDSLCQFLIRLPGLVLLMVCSYIIFADIDISMVIVAILAFTMKTAAYMCDIFYSAITSLNKGEGEAARSLGMSSLQTFWDVTLPQSIKVALPVYKNQFIVTLQETSIVGFLAVQDLTRASNIIASRTLDPFFSVIVISIAYLVIGFIASRLLSLLELKKHISKEDVGV